MLCCPQRPTLFKNKNKKSRVGKAPNFAQKIEKNDGICTQIWSFWVLLKKIIKKKKKISDRLTQLFQKSHLRATQQLFCFGLTGI